MEREVLVGGLAVQPRFQENISPDLSADLTL